MVHPSSFHPVAVPWCWLNSRAQPRCPHHTHCYTERTRIEKFGNVCASAHASSESWTPHCCERPCWIHYQHSPHSLLLLFSRFLFSTTLDDERMIVARHWLLLIECQNFLKYIRRKRSTKSRENLWKKSCLFLRSEEMDFISKKEALYSNSCVKFCSRDSRIPRVEDFIGVEVSRVY